MKRRYEVWIEIEDDGTTIWLVDAEQIQGEHSKGLRGAAAKLLFQFDADSPEEAAAIRNLRLGWEPYKPMGKAAECPNDCGAWYYPESSGECPHCGLLK